MHSVRQTICAYLTGDFFSTNGIVSAEILSRKMLSSYLIDILI